MTGKKALIINSGEIEEVSDADTLVQTTSVFQQVTDGSNSVNNVEAINLTGAKVTAKAYPTTGKAVVQIEAAGASNGYNHVNPYITCGKTVADKNDISIKPYHVMLPDETLLKQTSTEVIDLETDTDYEREQKVATASQTLFTDFDIELETCDIIKNTTELEGANLLLNFENNNTDSSVNAYSGTDYNMSYDAVTKKLGSYSASFNGTSSYIDYGTNGYFRMNKPFSIEFWANFTTAPAGGYQWPFEWRDDTNRINGIACSFHDTYKRSYFWIANDAANLKIAQIRTDAWDYVDGTWSHFVFSHNGIGRVSGMDIYVNGVKKTTYIDYDAIDGEFDFENNKLRVGKQNLGTYYTKGFLDGMIVHPKLLSQNEITARYNTGSGLILTPDYGINNDGNLELNSGAIVGDVIKALQRIREVGNWCYIYVTNDTAWSSNKAFISLTKPSFRGFHPNINAKYVGSFKVNSSKDIRQFFKYMNKNVLALIEKTIDLANSSSTVNEVRYDNYIPSTTNIVNAYSYNNFGPTYNSRIWEHNYLGTIRNYDTVRGGYPYQPFDESMRTTDRRMLWHSSVYSRSGHTNYQAMSGYIEDVNNPLQHIV